MNNYYINKTWKITRKVIITEAEIANYPQIEFVFLGCFKTYSEALKATEA